MPEMDAPKALVFRPLVKGNEARGTRLDSDGKFAPFARHLLQINRHIDLLFGERLDTLFTSSDSKISGFTRPHVIGFVADIFFPLWRADLFFSGFAVEFAGYVWTVAVSGNLKTSGYM